MLTGADRKAKYKGIEDLRKRRMENLQKLVDTHDSQAAFARAYGCNESFISLLLSGSRNIGEVLARDIEVKFAMPHGWLDSRH
jgi:hypothetical protein